MVGIEDRRLSEKLLMDEVTSIDTVETPLRIRKASIQIAKELTEFKLDSAADLAVLPRVYITSFK